MEAMKNNPIKYFFKKIKCVLFAAILVVGFPLNVYGEGPLIELNELINDSSFYDGKTVHVKGEVLLEALERKDYAWVNMNDGSNAMGVVMPLEATKKIALYGDYKTKGDTLEIEAVFHRACNEHGGDMDLHFVRMIAITKGGPIEHEVGSQRIILGILAIIAAVLSILGIKPSNSKK